MLCGLCGLCGLAAWLPGCLAALLPVDDITIHQVDLIWHLAWLPGCLSMISQFTMSKIVFGGRPSASAVQVVQSILSPTDVLPASLANPRTLVGALINLDAFS